MSVLARSGKLKRYFPADVLRVNADGTYQLLFQWGENVTKVVDSVPRDHIQLLDASKDEYEISHMLFSERTSKLATKLRAARRESKKTGHLLSSVGNLVFPLEIGSTM